MDLEVLGKVKLNSITANKPDNPRDDAFWERVARLRNRPLSPAPTVSPVSSHVTTVPTPAESESEESDYSSPRMRSPELPPLTDEQIDNL